MTRENDGFDNIRKGIRSRQAPNDHTIPVLVLGPRPECPKCGEKMLLQRPWRNEVFYREYWRCMTKKCHSRIQIDDDGYPVTKETKDAK